jgi:hypothetical protein
MICRLPIALVLVVALQPLPAAEKLRALILKGENNHDWKETTPVLK